MNSNVTTPQAIREVLDASTAPTASCFLRGLTMIRVCPKCDVPLFILHFKEIEVDFCDHCRGLWLDAGELEALMTQTGATRNDPLLRFQQKTGIRPKGRPHLCPRCDAALHEIQVEHAGSPNLTLDKCPRGHGLWFDDHELQQLLSMFPIKSGTAKTIDHLNDLFSTKTKL
jgi:uncharacterized protein